MAQRYILITDTGGTEYTLPTAGLDGNDALQWSQALDSIQVGGNEAAFGVGDEEASTDPIRIEFMIVGVGRAAARSLARAIFDNAEIALSLVRETDVSGGVIRAYRALNGLQGMRFRQQRGDASMYEVALTFLPKFGEATATRAETTTAYDAATKAVIG